MDASASSLFYGTSNPSGFVDSSYVASAVSGKLDTTAFSTVSGNFLTSHQSLAGYATESYVDSAVSGKLDVTASSQFLTSLPDDLATTGDVASAVSGKLDNSASGEWYPMTGNPSGFLTAHQSLAGYATEQYVDSAVSSKLDASAYDSAKFQLTADMSAYQLSGDYAYNSSLADKLDASASSQFAPSGNYISSVSVDSNMSGDGTTASPLGLNPIVILSAQGKKGFVYLNGTSAGSLTISGDTARLQGTGNKMMNVSFNCNPSAKGAIFIGPWNASNDWAGFSAQYSAGNINACLRASGSGTAGLTLWDTDGSEQMQKSSIPYWNSKQDASGMTAYQPVGDYQPSGDYIYASALGIAEV
jgi:hypothetical protein